jgi:WD40 repeat protein
VLLHFERSAQAFLPYMEHAVSSVHGTGEVGRQPTPWRAPRTHASASGRSAPDAEPLPPLERITERDAPATGPGRELGTSCWSEPGYDAVSPQRLGLPRLPPLKVASASQSTVEQSSHTLVAASSRSTLAYGNVFRQSVHPERTSTWSRTLSNALEKLLVPRQLQKQQTRTAALAGSLVGMRGTQPGKIALADDWVLLAIITGDDAVYCYRIDREHDTWTCTAVLRTRLVRSVTCLAFRPCMTQSWMLAAGCERGVALWTADAQSAGAAGPAPRSAETAPASVAHAPLYVCFQLLETWGHHHVSSVAWSADGHMLASSTCSDSAVLVWQVGAGSYQALYRIRGGVEHLCWSPSLEDAGVLLSIAHRGSVVRIWSTNPDGEWVSTAWDRPRLDPDLLAWHVKVQVGRDSHRRHYLIGADFTKSLLWCWTLEFQTHASLRPLATFRMPGEPQKLAWDPTGQRLAISFKEPLRFPVQSKTGDPDAADRAPVALYVTEMEPTVQVSLTGFVRAPESNAQVIDLRWHPQGPRRALALLVISWSNQQVTFYPYVL